ncbi:2-amino-4-hydroxy-6-hydroxymethyldihydropteridine diphosphokinase [Paraliomyxa miuraensis]|uniref:2-amino-4-hydroxy-6- hydroxymethyldihydropteridine diphosphokinase n=1 Tax=Paraliomyxa miuraensis TaxID=376150 RepID=UPI00225C0DC9|nr:2-amino-4-hydroxy-6-hydroxymethyldihydropteridine diphosphokinase [Paraliomyxa miuraensis]MCX4248076.1 2-amino-4-hydroxy-6-hydroxymethyldihydropteridine diphosphokinase [Paraliomyxa miuraensis]
MPSPAGSHAGGELRAFVGVGGNLGDRLATLRSAVRMLAEGIVPRTRVVSSSAVYETRPVGPSKGAFLNAVIELRTELEPRQLLEGLLELEARHGRERRKRWDARTLDLDLLVVQRADDHGAWQELRVDVEGLTLPHPRIGDRDFVLVPLSDLTGGEAVLDGCTAGAWLDAIAETERTILRRVLEVGELLR